ncbi:TrgA family protein [Maritimibacter dapengensis]|uniref:TrgA family protein n=1 Tax=Maritimibacter dapengensis TaxID=2836868 RepID=A0ABS6T2Y0_9RHOB|nr:TrgA family protein [Maritimibacter dapengensis]MBV7379614.1 TrgA family protein [Maritimibacter dapengensis]
MPTFARLAAAVLLAALGVGVSFLAMPYFPDEQPVGMMPVVAAIAGIIVGWLFTGRRVNRQYGNAVGVGVTSALAQAILTIFAFSSKLMIDRAFDMKYKTVMQAVVGVFEAAMEYLEVIAEPDVIAATLIGGAIVGQVTHWVAKRSR